MPQASDELRARIQKRFGTLGTEGPSRFLEAAGYRLTPDWEWVGKTGVKGLRDMTRGEFECLLFLCHEWDYGSLAA